jgi:tyrosinase
VNVTLPGGNIAFTRIAGTGGGCLYNGPLVNWTINLGPVTQLDGTGGPPNPRADGLGYNPHCVIRDFLPDGPRSTNSYQNVTDLILNSDSESPIDAGSFSFFGMSD